MKTTLALAALLFLATASAAPDASAKILLTCEVEPFHAGNQSFYFADLGGLQITQQSATRFQVTEADEEGINAVNPIPLRVLPEKPIESFADLYRAAAPILISPYDSRYARALEMREAKYAISVLDLQTGASVATLAISCE